MTRMFTSLLAIGMLTQFALATDVDKYPPGHKPFNSPKSPVPTGVFAADSCWGYHATRWTPWHQACGNCGTTSVTQSCTNNAIILFDAPVASPAKPLPGVMSPAPESTMPMPPAKK